ncbi:hypothetical protein D3C75_1144860 [compost metagenome]
MDLDLVHIHCSTAKCFNHFDPITCTTFLVSSYVAFQVRSNFCNELHIGAKAARCNDYCVRCNVLLIGLVEDNGNTINFTVSFINFCHFSIYKKRNALFLYIFQQSVYKELPYC